MSGLFQAHMSARVIWFHVCGWGVHVRYQPQWRPLFSERYGQQRVWRIGWLRVKVLRPDRVRKP